MREQSPSVYVKADPLDEDTVYNEDPRLPLDLEYPPAEEGLNKWTWDMKSQGLKCTENIALFVGFDGPRVAPGEFKSCSQLACL